MSVTGPGANITAIQKLSELELQNGVIGESSWHNRYKDSCYIFIGGLDKRMTEGDIIIIFSQFGEPIDINLKRDSKTGASLGYCFLGYRDQRSTILAVDNFNGYTLLGRRLRVDHVLDYKAPVQYEDELDDDGNKIVKEYKPTGAEGAGLDNYYVTESENLLKETHRSRQNKHTPHEALDDDEKWAREFEEMLNKDKEPNDTRSSDEKHSHKSSSGKHIHGDHKHKRDRSSHRRHKRDRSPHRRHRSYSNDRYKHRHKDSYSK